MLNLTGLALALALAAQGATATMPATADAAQDITVQGGELAANLILSGQKQAAMTRLEQQRDLEPDDPAILINLGIAYAHMGLDEKARVSFKDALASDEQQDLDTADGRTLDSRMLARQALQMLDRGEFRTTNLAAK